MLLICVLVLVLFGLHLYRACGFLLKSPALHLRCSSLLHTATLHAAVLLHCAALHLPRTDTRMLAEEFILIFSAHGLPFHGRIHHLFRLVGIGVGPSLKRRLFIEQGRRVRVLRHAVGNVGALLKRTHEPGILHEHHGLFFGYALALVHILQYIFEGSHLGHLRAGISLVVRPGRRLILRQRPRRTHTYRYYHRQQPFAFHHMYLPPVNRTRT